MKITRKSAITGIEHVRDIPVNPEDYVTWIRGHAGIHEVMPYLSDVDRDFILSGIIPGEWKAAFIEELIE